MGLVVALSMLLAPVTGYASCHTEYFECTWFDQNCDPCSANAIVYICSNGIFINVVGCCYCT